MKAHKVEYVIIGAYALAFHGAPRYTGDINILVKPNVSHAGRILQVLNDFGFGKLELTAYDFSEAGKIVQLGVPPVRVDIETSVTGLAWEQIFANRVSGEYGGVPVSYIGRRKLIATIKALGRHRALAALEALGERGD